MKRINRQKRLSLAIAAVIAALLAAMCALRADWVERVEHLYLSGSYIPNAELPPVGEKLVLVMGNDYSLKEIGMWPWPRSTYIEMLERVRLARVVAFDILLVDEGAEGTDSLLAEEMAEHNVVLCYAEEETGKATLHSKNEFISAAVGEGYSNGYSDSDGIFRRYRFMNQRQVIAPSFVCATAMAAGYSFDWDYIGNGATLYVTSPSGSTHSMSLDGNMNFLRFPATKGSIQTYQMSDVLLGRVPEEEFRDAIVMLGFDASGVSDIVSASEGLVSGTQYNMDSLYTLLSGFTPPRISVSMEVAATVVLFLASLLLTSRLKIHLSLLAPTALVMGWLALGYILFMKGVLWLSVFWPVSAVLIGYVAAVLLELLRSRREKRVHELSMDSLLGLGNSLGEAADFEDFPQYLSVLAKEVEDATQIKILRPLLDEDDEECAPFGVSDRPGGLFIAYNAAPPPQVHLVLLALPSAERDETGRKYTLLGMSERLPTATIRSAATVVMSAYVYFNAAQEAKKRSDMFYALISCMVSAVDARDPITSGHSQRVAEMSENLARWMGLPRDQVEQMRFSGVIHDIGKIGIPDNVLNKPGPFSIAEYKAMQTHPAKGAAIMRPIELQLQKGVLDGVHYHHERLDGRGYPYGKTADELTITPRIIKVADVYDALISKRQYKKAWPLDKVLNVLYEGRGTEFDPDVVDTLIEHVKPEGWEPSAQAPGREGPSPRALEKYMSIADRLWRAYDGVNDRLEHIGGCAEKPRFDCRDVFCSMEWYGSFAGDEFLSMLPSLIFTTGDVKIFALKYTDSTTPYSQDAAFVLYYFLRGFLTAGAVIGLPDMKETLEQTFGSAAHTGQDSVMWDVGRMAVLLTEGVDTTPSAAYYIMKSTLDG